MGYAIMQNGSWRAVTPDMALMDDETYSETLPEPTPEQVAAVLLAELSGVVQAYIDQVARERAYNDGLHAASYAVSTIPTWQAEGQAFIKWRDSVWFATIAIMDDCKAGLRDIPSADELLGELPKISWPGS